ncbi:MAG: hypothetical protein JO089_08320 [Alphaproteobacteria bacterium]|nr:hypothetical protein [Alphaproteobacteria bacterium]
MARKPLDSKAEARKNPISIPEAETPLWMKWKLAIFGRAVAIFDTMVEPEADHEQSASLGPHAAVAKAVVKKLEKFFAILHLQQVNRQNQLNLSLANKTSVAAKMEQTQAVTPRGQDVSQSAFMGQAAGIQQTPAQSQAQQPSLGTQAAQSTDRAAGSTVQQTTAQTGTQTQMQMKLQVERAQDADKTRVTQQAAAQPQGDGTAKNATQNAAKASERASMQQLSAKEQLGASQKQQADKMNTTTKGESAGKEPQAQNAEKGKKAKGPKAKGPKGPKGSRGSGPDIAVQEAEAKLILEQQAAEAEQMKKTLISKEPMAEMGRTIGKATDYKVAAVTDNSAPLSTATTKPGPGREMG